jgi:regulator of nucleoside diphosphate kinase
MNSSIVLCTSDKQRLQRLLTDQRPGLCLQPNQVAALKAILRRAKVTDDPAILASQVGLDDRVTLVSPEDPADVFDLTVVEPVDADIDRDKLPVSLPISLALLGHRRGEKISWETARGLREMRIVNVVKEKEKEFSPAASGGIRDA